MLDKIDRLPGAERKLPVYDRDLQRGCRLTSLVMSIKPSPSVCTIRIDDTRVSVLEIAGRVRERCTDLCSNLSLDITLHPVCGLDQSAPGALQEGNHAIDVLVARQLQLKAAAFSCIGLAHIRIAVLDIAFGCGFIGLRTGVGSITLRQFILQS